MSRTALAFMSYVNLDDQHEQGRLTRFRECLSGEVRMQTGEPFDIFQDRKDIAWGQQWQERINLSLDAVTFLIPIITPGFFKSDACRDEMERFLKREEELERGDLILPVYYVNCPVLQNKAKREHDTLAQVIAARQYADWRDLRFKPFDSEQVREHLAKMAQQIIAALGRRQEEFSAFNTVRPEDAPRERLDSQPSKKGREETVSRNMISNPGNGKQNIAQGNNAIGAQINNYYDTSRPATVMKTEPPTLVTEPYDYVNDQPSFRELIGLVRFICVLILLGIAAGALTGWNDTYRAAIISILGVTGSFWAICLIVIVRMIIGIFRSKPDCKSRLQRRGNKE